MAMMGRIKDGRAQAALRALADRLDAGKIQHVYIRDLEQPAGSTWQEWSVRFEPDDRDDKWRMGDAGETTTEG